MGLKPSGLDSTPPIAVGMVGSPEAKSREVAISGVLLPDCSRFRSNSHVTRLGKGLRPTGIDHALKQRVVINFACAADPYEERAAPIAIIGFAVLVSGGQDSSAFCRWGPQPSYRHLPRGSPRAFRGGTWSAHLWFTC